MLSKTDRSLVPTARSPPRTQHNCPLRIISEVDRPGGDEDTYPGWNGDHVAALTVRNTSRSQTRSTPGSARTTAPPISIVIASRPFLVSVGAASWRGSVTTGTNAGASSIGRVSWLARAALRQPRRSVPWPRQSSGAAAQHQPEYQLVPAAPKRQQRGQPYMRTHPFPVVRMLQLNPGLARCGDNAAYKAASLGANKVPSGPVRFSSISTYNNCENPDYRIQSCSSHNRGMHRSSTAHSVQNVENPFLTLSDKLQSDYQFN
jgi:hypothetical protein